MSSAGRSSDSYNRWRSAVFNSSWLLYAAYYLCRENLNTVLSLPGVRAGQDALAKLLFTFALAYVFGHIFSGTITDLRGPRRIALTGGLVSAAATTAMAFTHNLHNLLILQLLNGFGQGLGFPALAKMLATWFSRRERPVVLAWWSASYSLGGGLAAGVALWVLTPNLVSIWGRKQCFMLPPLLLTLLSLYFYLSTRDKPEDVSLEPLGVTDAVEEREAEGVLRGWWMVLSNGNIRTISAMYFFLKMTRYALLFWLPLYLVQTSHISNNRAMSSGALFELFGFAGALFAVHLSTRYCNSRRYPVATMFLFGLGFLSLLQPLIVNLGWWASAISICAMGLMVYAVDALMVSIVVLETVPLSCAARAVAAVNGSGSVGQMFAPLLVTWFSHRYGWENIFNLFLVTFMIAAVIVAPRWNDGPRETTLPQPLATQN
jgi:MFS transporter, OPA family, glycerol-3-phosphate transporter